MKYNISELIVNQELEKVPQTEAKKEQENYRHMRRVLKSFLFKHYYNEGYFEGLGLNSIDRELLKNGVSPIKIIDGNEQFLFTFHHKKPMSFGGKSYISNLIPLPRKFHDFIHVKIIDPQTRKLESGKSIMVYGLPDFKKISLSMMLDPQFMQDYADYMNNIYKTIEIPKDLSKKELKRLKRKARYKKQMELKRLYKLRKREENGHL